MFTVPECFRHDAKWRGDVIIRTYFIKKSTRQVVDFYCHSGVICPISSFFDAALSGPWRETQDARVLPGSARMITDGSRSTRSSNATRENDSLSGIIEMQEESPEVMRDFLCFVYHLAKGEISLDNIDKLSTLADKIDCPALQAACKKLALSEKDKQPLPVMYWAWNNGEYSLVEDISEKMLSNMDKYKGEKAYLTLPSELRYLLEKTWAEWLIQYIEVDHRIRDEGSSDWSWSIWTRGYVPEVLDAFEELKAHPSPSNLEEALGCMEYYEELILPEDIEDLRNPKLQVKDIKLAIARASKS